MPIKYQHAVERAMERAIAAIDRFPHKNLGTEDPAITELKWIEINMKLVELDALVRIADGVEIVSGQIKSGAFKLGLNAKITANVPYGDIDGFVRETVRSTLRGYNTDVLEVVEQMRRAETRAQHRSILGNIIDTIKELLGRFEE